jgi:hypothetical protein
MRVILINTLAIYIYMYIDIDIDFHKVITVPLL